MLLLFGDFPHTLLDKNNQLRAHGHGVVPNHPMARLKGPKDKTLDCFKVTPRCLNWVTRSILIVYTRSLAVRMLFIGSNTARSTPWRALHAWGA